MLAPASGRGSASNGDAHGDVHGDGAGEKRQLAFRGWGGVRTAGRFRRFGHAASECLPLSLQKQLWGSPPALCGMHSGEAGRQSDIPKLDFHLRVPLGSSKPPGMDPFLQTGL